MTRWLEYLNLPIIIVKVKNNQIHSVMESAFLLHADTQRSGVLKGELGSRRKLTGNYLLTLNSYSYNEKNWKNGINLNFENTFRYKWII